MRAITIHNPFAHAVRKGWKRFETRSRPMHYRGPIAIHAGKSTESVQKLKDLGYHVDEASLVYGAVVAIAEVSSCWQMTEKNTEFISEDERYYGDWRIGRYAIRLQNIQPLKEPHYCSGKQGLWSLTPEQVYAVMGRVNTEVMFL